MFGKILKYDLRSIARYWWIVAVSTLGLSVLGSLAMRFAFEVTEAETSMFILSVGMIFSLFFSFMSIFGIIASIIVTQILIYLRFYKHFFTDEGYLTFTLPVSRKTLLLSKTLNAFIWTLLHVFLTVIAVIIFIAIAPPTFGGGLINTDVLFAIPDAMGLAVSELWNNIGAWSLVYGAEFILMLAISMLFSISLAHMCITIGAVVAKKLKLLAAIGIYYGVNTLLSSILPAVLFLPLFSFVEGLLEELAQAPEQVILAVIAIALLILCLIMAAATFLIYSLTLDKLERRLNLA